MSLPNEDDLKAYNRVETTVEDDLFFELLATAKAFVAQYLKVPLESTQRVFRGRKPRQGDRGEWAEQLVIPVIPCSTTATITDLDGNTVDADTYEIDPRTGMVNVDRYESFDNPPYTITVDVGYEEHPEYDEAIEPVLRQAILWVGTDLYRRRNPGAIYEQSGGQVSITYNEDDLPPVIRMKLEVLRPAARIW